MTALGSCNYIGNANLESLRMLIPDMLMQSLWQNAMTEMQSPLNAWLECSMLPSKIRPLLFRSIGLPCIRKYPSHAWSPRTVMNDLPTLLLPLCGAATELMLTGQLVHIKLSLRCLRPPHQVPIEELNCGFSLWGANVYFVMCIAVPKSQAVSPPGDCRSGACGPVLFLEQRVQLWPCPFKCPHAMFRARGSRQPAIRWVCSLSRLRLGNCSHVCWCLFVELCDGPV